MSRQSPGSAPSSFNRIGTSVAIGVAVMGLYPIARIGAQLLFSDGTVNIAAVRETARLPELPLLLRDTLCVVFISGLLALVIGTFFAWANERTDARMGAFTDALPLVPFLLPPIAGSAGLVLLMSPRSGILNGYLRNLLDWMGFELAEGPLNIFGWPGLIFGYVIYQVPYAYLVMSAGFRTLDPTLEEQSRMCGATQLQTLRKVVLPSLAPSLGASALLLVWSGFAMLSVPIILARPVNIKIVAVKIVELISLRYPPEMDVALGLSAIVVVFVGATWYAQNRVLRSGRFSTVGAKRVTSKRLLLGKARPIVRGLMVSYVLLAAILPGFALVVVALQGQWRPQVEPGLFRIDVLVRAWTREGDAIVNSVLLGASSGIIGIVCAALIATRLLRKEQRWTRILDGAIKFPAIVSNIVLAVGVLLAFAGPPFNLVGTLWILLIGYFIAHFPQGAVAADAAAVQIDASLSEASSISGAAAGRTFLRVSLPLMLPGLIAGWALLFVRIAGDVTVSAILAGTRNQVIGRRILEISESGTYAELASIATILVCVSAVVLVATFRYVRHRTRWLGNGTATHMLR